MTRRRLALAAALVALALPACSRRAELYPVLGKVYLDGKPAAGALVVLHPVGDADAKAVRPSGYVGPDGSFALASYFPDARASGAGAPAGEYVVTITWPPEDVKEYTLRHQGAPVPDKLQGRYGNPSSSPLPKATVHEGPTELPPFELKKS